MKFTFSNIVKQVLNESFQDFEYHFTTLDNLVRICQTGRIPLSHTYAKGAEVGINKNHTFYLSLTRVKDGRVGYSHKYKCRICFDGKALATRFKGGAVNYWKNLGDKRQYYKNLVNRREINPDGTLGRELNDTEDLKPRVKYDIQYKDMSQNKNADPYNFSGMQFQTQTENEDRLLTNEPFIDHIEKFVTSIDILYVKDRYQEYDDATKRKICACLRSRFRNLIRVYDNDKDFNLGTKNIINKKFEWDGEFSMEAGPESTVKDDLNNNLYALKSLMNIFLYVDCFKKPDKEKAVYIKKKLKKYNLDAYSRFISTFIFRSQTLTVIPNKIESDFEDAISTAAKSRSQDSQYISKMAGDWMKEHGFKRLGDIAKSLEKKYEDIDYEKKITFLTYGDILIPDPAHTNFWQVTEANNYDKKDFVKTMIEFVKGTIDGSKRNVRGNDIEKLKKYLQHLTHKCTVEQMFSLLKKLDIEATEYFSVNFEGFNYKKLDYYKARHKWLPKYCTIPDEQKSKYSEENEKEIAKYYAI